MLCRCKATKKRLLPCTVKLVKAIDKTDCDVVCVIGCQIPPELEQLIKEYRCFNKGFNKVVSCIKSPELDLPVIYSPLPELTDYHDVRVFQVAAAESMWRVAQAGFKTPLLVVPESKVFENTEICSLLGALYGLYVPIQLREDVPDKCQLIDNLSVLISNSKAEELLRDALTLESGRYVARDIGAADPERMSPRHIEEYIKELFPNLLVNVISDWDALSKEYPLFAAVNRAANSVSRHQGRIVYIEYKPPQPAKKTLMLVGEGDTYNTGGADIKAGGLMVGMSRDKCGAAAVAGFMQIVDEQCPPDIHVLGVLCLVRNSVGEESYVADEIITSRAGVRVRVGNTDAEGRMCMADALCAMKEIAVAIATLTGHAVNSAGIGYSIVLDNSVARASGHATKLQAIAESFGEPLEISVVRHEDFEFNVGKVIGEDILQSNNAPSVRTPRGHQIPVSFLMQVTGLDQHGLTSVYPLKYTHFDIASSALLYPKIHLGTPIVALAKTHLVEGIHKMTEDECQCVTGCI